MYNIARVLICYVYPFINNYKSIFQAAQLPLQIFSIEHSMIFPSIENFNHWQWFYLFEINQFLNQKSNRTCCNAHTRSSEATKRTRHTSYEPKRVYNSPIKWYVELFSLVKIVFSEFHVLWFVFLVYFQSRLQGTHRSESRKYTSISTCPDATLCRHSSSQQQIFYRWINWHEQ